MERLSRFSRMRILSAELDSPWSWFLCFLAALCNALHFGVSLSFGILLPYLLEHFKASIDITVLLSIRSQSYYERKQIAQNALLAAMVGSLAIAITFVATFPAAKLVECFGLRAVTFLGGMLCLICLVLTSFANTIVLLLFTYSIGFGIGASFLYTSSMFMCNSYFKLRRNIALGVVCAGGGSGYLAFGPLIQLSIDKYGWKLSCRYIGALFIVPVIISLLYGSREKKESIASNEQDEEQNSKPKSCRTTNKVFDGSVLKNSSFTVSVASMTLAGLAHYIPQIYMVELCEKLGIPSTRSSRLLIFIGLATLVSRMSAGILQNTPRVSTLFIFQSSQFLDALAQLAVPFAYKYEHFIVICVLYGLADGGFTTSLNSLLLSTVRPEQVSSGFGFGCLVSSVSIAAGAPLAGLLIKHFNSHNPAFFAGAAILFVSSLLPSVRYLIVSLTSPRIKRSKTEEVRLELCLDHKLEKHGPQVNIIVNQECEMSPFQVLLIEKSTEKIAAEVVI